MHEKAPAGKESRPPLARREFLERAIGRSLAVLGVAAAAGAVAYKEPQLRSFSPETTAYAQSTGAGTFTLRGTT
jgi:hypothetical protein